MLRHLKEAFAGEDGAVIGKKSRFGVGEQKKITGTVALMKQVSLDVTALVSEGLHELFHKRVHLQLVSTQNSDSGEFFSQTRSLSVVAFFNKKLNKL